MSDMTFEEMCEKIERHLAEPEVQAKRQRFREGFRFAQAHIDEWRLALPDQWVAVLGKDIVAAGATTTDFFRDADTKGIDLADCYVTFVAKERPILILW